VLPPDAKVPVAALPAPVRASSPTNS
jgi:hypothetical protein